MKKSLLLAIFATILTAHYTQAQVKFGDNKAVINPGSLLELESPNKGVLLPRVSLTKTTIWGLSGATPVNGMVVYNTNAAITDTVTAPALPGKIGMYYWDGARWVGTANVPQTQWPYRTNDNLIGTAGNAQGIVAMPGAGLVASGQYSHAEGLNDTASANYAWAIGQGNLAAGTHTFVTGLNNKSSATHTLVSGQGNTLSPLSNHTFTGGMSNVVTDAQRSLIYGASNSVVTNFNPAVYGEANLVVGKEDTLRGTTISGVATSGHMNALFGYKNRLEGTQTLVTGDRNRIFRTGSTLVSGGSNNVDNISRSIVAGVENIVYGPNPLANQGVAVFGYQNRDSAAFTLVAGQSNTLTSTAAHTVVGGQANNATGTHSAVFGYANSDSSNYTLVAGHSNKLNTTANISFIAGQDNVVSATGNNGGLVIGGNKHRVLGNDNYLSTMVGGEDTLSSSYESFVGGRGTLLRSSARTIAYGGANKVNTVVDGAVFGGENKVYGVTPLVAGFQNIDSANYSIVTGRENFLSANGRSSAVFGEANRGSAAYTLVAGQSNTLSPTAAQSTVGGFRNMVNAPRAAVFGDSNSVGPTAINSLVAGYKNNVTNLGNSIVAGDNNTVSPYANPIIGGGYIVAGQRNIVSGNNSIMAGTDNKDYSLANIVSGYNNTLNQSANYSIVNGSTNTLRGGSSLVLGHQNTMTDGRITNNATYSAGNIIVGYQNTLNHSALTDAITTPTPMAAAAFGRENTSSAQFSLVAGHSNVIQEAARYSLVAGQGNLATATMPHATVVGKYNVPVTNALFTVGNGTSTSVRSNIMVGMLNGNVGIGTNAPGARLEIASGTANVSGMKFSNISSATPTGSGLPLGVDASGNVITVAATPTTTADNGLTKTVNNIQLGGALTQATNISAISATNKLTFTGDGVDAINFDANTLSIDATNNRVGIGTNTPNSTLAVEGSLETGYLETTGNLTLTAAHHYVSYTGTTDATFTLPLAGTGSASFTGRIYRIKNISANNVTIVPNGSNTMRVSTGSNISSFTLPPGHYAEIVNNAQTAANPTWDISFIGYPNLPNQVWTPIDFFDYTATARQDFSGNTVGDLTGYNQTINIPAGRQAKVVISYSIPVGKSAASSISGYYGITMQKQIGSGSFANFDGGSRKYTQIPATSSMYSMVTVSATVSDNFTASTTDRSITYKLRSYLESNTGTVNFNMFKNTAASGDDNYNWGYGYWSVTVYLK